MRDSLFQSQISVAQKHRFMLSQIHIKRWKFSWNFYSNNKESHKSRHFKIMSVETSERQVLKYRPPMLPDSIFSPLIGGEWGFVKLKHSKRFSSVVRMLGPTEVGKE